MSRSKSYFKWPIGRPINIAYSRKTAKFRSQKPFLNFPSLIFITDQYRLSNPEAIASALPRGSGVLLRDYELAHRRLLGERLRDICRRKRLIFLVAGNGRLAASLSANGIHLREAQIPEIPYWRTRYPHWLVTVAAHSRVAISKAGNAGAHAALISPIFKTDSHPDVRPLGITKLRHLVASSPIPLYALGGLKPKNQTRLMNIGLRGIAGISGFAQS